MSPSTPSNSTKKTLTNPKLASSIVHKPFSTGTINIFNPPKSNPNGESVSSKLVLDAVLETELPTELKESIKPKWHDRLLNPWVISAIAILLLANSISGIFIWRHSQISSAQSNELSESPTIGNSNLVEREFMPLNLSTLSSISSKDSSQEAKTPTNLTPDAPIHPALIPLNQVDSLNTQYHYVLTEYTGDRSLILARQKVKNISLVNFPQGVFIYLGAFTEKTSAIAFVEQLKQEGLNAYIYPFD